MNQVQAIDLFFKSSIKNLEAASQAVVNSRVKEFKGEIQSQLKTRFKRKVGGVRVTELPPKPNLGPAAYVSIKPAFLSIFEEGGTVTGQNGYLVVLLPEGKKLKFTRPGKRGWAAIWATNQNRLRLVPAGSNYLVLCRVSRTKEVPVYLLTKKVNLPKRLSFNEAAKRIGKGMAEEVQSLMEGKFNGA
jgi:hypothetical protein